MSSSLKKVPGLLTLGIAMVMSVQFILLSALDVLSSSDHRSSLQLKRLLPLQTTRTDGTTLNATRFRPANSSFNSLQANTTSLEESASASACLLVCDDNHFLIEWIAYHYHVINLRHLIITHDPKCRTSPWRVLERWLDRIEIELWDETRFMPDDDPDNSSKSDEDNSKRKESQTKNRLGLHRDRQRMFNVECLRTLKRQGKGWVLLSDTDEFVTINPILRKPKREHYDHDLPPITEPGSVMTFLQNLVVPTAHLAVTSPCVPIFRKQFNSLESPNARNQEHVPSGFDGSSFLTLRWRRCGPKRRKFKTILGRQCTLNRVAGPVKVVIDLARLRLQDLYHDKVKGNPHRPLESICSEENAWAGEDEVGLIIHHYLGTSDQFSYRVTDSRGLGYRMARYVDMNNEIGTKENDDLRPWLDGFVHSVGEDEALRLLFGVGELEPMPNHNTANILTPPNATQGTDDYQVGDLVQENWRGHGDWFWAQVSAVFTGEVYNVVYLKDCTEDLGVGWDQIRRNGSTADGLVFPFDQISSETGSSE